MKKKLIIVLLMLSMFFAGGCMFGSGGFWTNKVTDQDLKTTAQAAASKQAAVNVSARATDIRKEAKEAKVELKKDVKDGVLPIENAGRKIERWERVDASAKEIDNNGDTIVSSTSKILKINNGTIELTWLGWSLIVGFVTIIGLALFTYFTIMLKQWGILKVIRTGVEGTAELAAKSWLDDDTKDDSEMPPAMFEKAVRHKRSTPK